MLSLELTGVFGLLFGLAVCFMVVTQLKRRPRERQTREPVQLAD